MCIYRHPRMIKHLGGRAAHVWEVLEHKHYQILPNSTIGNILYLDVTASRSAGTAISYIHSGETRPTWCYNSWQTLNQLDRRAVWNWPTSYKLRVEMRERERQRDRQTFWQYCSLTGHAGTGGHVSLKNDKKWSAWIMKSGVLLLLNVDLKDRTRNVVAVV